MCWSWRLEGCGGRGGGLVAESVHQRHDLRDWPQLAGAPQEQVEDDVA
jgi:hypothetical protein